jgi:hypothetical protein
VVCSEGYKFDMTQYQCVKIDVFPAVPACPPAQPFFDGAQCVACYLPKYWNLDTSKCEDCESGQHYDISEKKCVKCEDGFEYSFATHACEEKKQAAVSCPDETPLYDGGKCVACPLPSFWNADSSTC